MRTIIFPAMFVMLAAFGATSFLYEMTPLTRGDTAEMVSVHIAPGEGARAIADELQGQGIIRSAAAFYVASLLGGYASSLKPGDYSFSPTMGAHNILEALAAGPDREREVRVREGATIYDMDAALAEAGVLPRGALLAYGSGGQDPATGQGTPSKQGTSTLLEGYLFPDTYRFFASSTVQDVINRFSTNFQEKAKPLLPDDPKKAHDALVLASLLEKEIPLAADRQVVAGILEKRLSAGMPLQVDATVCYAKLAASQGVKPCLPLSTLDFAARSPYNTYIVKGLPPEPIGNPGREAIDAALHPIVSPYWFYLSDPASGRTIFATTLDEHNRNRVKYLTN